MADTEAPTFTGRNMITAMCLWETLLSLASGGDDEPADDENDRDDAAESGDDPDAGHREKAVQLLDDHGSFTMREALVTLADACEKGWDALVAGSPETPDQFDWDWCPRFIGTAMDDGTLDEAVAGQYRP